MKILVLYLATAVVFFAVEAVGLRRLVKPVFERHVGHLLADPFRVAPALLFYFGYVAGVLWFVSLPAARMGDPWAALIGGVALGVLVYGGYELTNYATLRDWSVEQVVVDTAWGAALTGFSAWAGVLLALMVG